jgi:preprotein translocase subunit YajC
MDSDQSTFIGEVWKYKPIIIILGVVFIIIFCLLVIDTHRHRKKEHKKRHKTKHRE